MTFDEQLAAHRRMVGQAAEQERRRARFERELAALVLRASLEIQVMQSQALAQAIATADHPGYIVA